MQNNLRTSYAHPVKLSRSTCNFFFLKQGSSVFYNLFCAYFHESKWTNFSVTVDRHLRFGSCIRIKERL